MEYRADVALIPLVLRVSGSQGAYVSADLSVDEDILPTVVEMDNDGRLLSRGTRVTEVHSETTDDT